MASFARPLKDAFAVLGATSSSGHRFLAVKPYYRPAFGLHGLSSRMASTRMGGMDSSIPRDTSFTNLLEDSYDEYMSGSSRISGEDSVPQAQAFSQMSPPQVESTTKKLQCGSNFTIQEDVLLVSAFLNVNQDAMQSTNQKRTTYWSRIWEYYHQWKTFTSERKESSLTNRWSTIQLCTNKFCGCLAQIESKNESGKTNEDKQKSSIKYCSIPNFNMNIVGIY
ncbi:glutathione S-transferase T3-like [Quercus lobata]|uniref:glutathione S-transferase T3-like n=1 Tax=Quercus lobata TaxID=97700 RepID=UPI001246E0BB|nr:glutathione S-transferase T3-like [Quercus lobata]